MFTKEQVTQIILIAQKAGKLKKALNYQDAITRAKILAKREKDYEKAAETFCIEVFRAGYKEFGLDYEFRNLSGPRFLEAFCQKHIYS